MGEILALIVPGLCETKGSWRCSCKGNKPRLYADNDREEAWALTIAWSVRAALRGMKPTIERVGVKLEFRLPPIVGRKNRRDLDKMMRSVLDALTGLVYVDDEQVDEAILVKRLVVHDQDDSW